MKRERRELLEAGWESVEREGEIVWRRPGSPYLYPKDVALRLIREEEKKP
jgi:hypothetical protein